jgi:type III secretion system YscD/HrpQ family protein
MAGYLIAEEGPLIGLIINLEEGNEWILGRDPDESTIVLEDPRVSRKHVICKLTPDGFFLENLSSVNPSTQNGKVITEPVLLQEGDILQIGSTYFRFTEKNPVDQKEEEIKEEIEEPLLESAIDEDDLTSLSFDMPKASRWLLKVISGPNAGAEFPLYPSATYILGRDGNLSDVVFHDLSVSRRHAKIVVDQNEKVFIEDFETRNGVTVNGELIREEKELSSQDLVALGTTSFLVIDREQIHDTIISPPLIASFKADVKQEETPVFEEPGTPLEPPAKEKSWKDLVISTKHLVFAGAFSLFLLIILTATFSLFKSEKIEVPVVQESEILKEALKDFPSIQFSFNEGSGKLFLIGHLLTAIEKQELSYILSNYPFIRSIEDTIVIDELVWQNMNAVLLSNPDWQAVSIQSTAPGKFIIKGYVQTIEQAMGLNDYIEAHFPYPNLLENQVIVANNLSLQVESLLMDQGFNTVLFNLANGELVLSGRVDDDRLSDFSNLMKVFQKLPGVRIVQNFVIHSSGSSLTIDLSSEYTVSGFSKGDNNERFVVINQKIFSKGDFLNGMKITEIHPSEVLLEKDGIKFKINYNLQ